jgi:hypothetical protein
MGFPKLFMPPFRPICPVIAVLRLSLVHAFVLVNATFMPVGITIFVISRPAVLGNGQRGCSQQQSQY